jgi:hypothetical protein
VQQHLEIGLILQSTLTGLFPGQSDVFGIEPDGYRRSGIRSRRRSSSQTRRRAPAKPALLLLRLLEVLEQLVLVIKPSLRLFGPGLEIRKDSFFHRHSPLIGEAEGTVRAIREHQRHRRASTKELGPSSRHAEYRAS